jgi:hypothetical protein
MKKILPVLWMISMYVLTAVTINDFPCPNKKIPLAGAICESEHIVVHSSFYAVQCVLLMIALSDSSPRSSRWKLLGISMGLIACAGIGQEALQMILRARLHLLASAFDLLIDVSGAALGGWLAISGLIPIRLDAPSLPIP